MKTAHKNYMLSLTDLLTADTTGNENARQAAANEHSRNMALIEAQKDSDRRSYLYSLFALNSQPATQQAELTDNRSRRNMIIVIAAIVGAVLILKNI